MFLDMEVSTAVKVSLSVPLLYNCARDALHIYATISVPLYVFSNIYPLPKWTFKMIFIFSSVDLYNNIAIQQQGEGSDANSCLDWPTVQQDAVGFNELSDVIIDSNRLNKETTILLKLLGMLVYF